MNNICVFCGSGKGINPQYESEAKKLGILLAKGGKSLIYGGGKVGLMGVIADAVLASGGKAIGVIPQFLMDKEVGHDGLTELILVESMHERKQKMAELADAFVALPGGIGTLEELAEILTWVQLSLIKKPVAVLNTNHYYDPLLALFDQMVNEGFLKKDNRGSLLDLNHTEYVVAHLERYYQADQRQLNLEKT